MSDNKKPVRFVSNQSRVDSFLVRLKGEGREREEKEKRGGRGWEDGRMGASKGGRSEQNERY